jgi:precorrin-4/cobalt-precorrin-4 C11-methyltransferase
MLVVHKASWPGAEKIIRGTLADIKREMPGREDRQPGDDRRQPDAGRCRLARPAFARNFTTHLHAPLPQGIETPHGSTDRMK